MNGPPRNPDLPASGDAQPEAELDELLRHIRKSAASGPAAWDAGGAGREPLPQKVFLESMRSEIQHFLSHADLEREMETEGALFERLKALGEKLNDSSLYEPGAEESDGSFLGRIKAALRRLLWPVFRLVLGPRLHRQNQFNTTLVQFVNTLSQLEAQVVSAQRHYKAHQSNLGKNLLRVLDLLHQSDLRMNEKIDLLVADLDRRVLALRQSLEQEKPRP